MANGIIKNEAIEIEDLGVELQEALDIRSLEDGTTFEIKVPEERNPFNYDQMPEELMWKYSRPDLLANDSDDEFEDVNKTPFEKRENEMEDISKLEDDSIPEKSVLKQLLLPGIGGKLPDKALVTIHYNAYLDESPEPFDSTYFQGKPKNFRLGSGEVVLGLDLAVKSMKVKEKSEFLVSPDFAYGKLGCLDRIPPESTILFVVELLGCLDNAAMVQFDDLSPEEQSEANFRELMKVARAQHLTGNDLEKKRLREKALPVYMRASRLLESANYANAEQEAEGEGVLLKLYVNITRLSFEFRKYRKCCKYADVALKINRESVKALYWRGRACIELGQWDRAKKSLMKASRIDPNIEVIKALEELDRRSKKTMEKEKQMYRNMFPGWNVEEKNENALDNEYLETVKTVLEQFHLSETSDPLVIKLVNEAESACFNSVAEKYGLKVSRSGEAIKISKKE